MAPQIRLRRIYDGPSPGDGVRVLVDRVWPRGLTKDAARLDEWAAGVAPSTFLRRWYRHDPRKFAEFRGRYQAELAEAGLGAALDGLRLLARNAAITLLTATKDIGHSHAAVLAAQLRQRENAGPPPGPFTGGKSPGTRPAERGEPACWAHLVCAECGAVASEGHRRGCRLAPHIERPG